LARELVNRIQNIRKDSGLEVTDRISVKVSDVPEWREAVTENKHYICSETLATTLELDADLKDGNEVEIDSKQAWIKISW
jgi:isoleucyl-tRNA synthetase